MKRIFILGCMMISLQVLAQTREKNYFVTTVPFQPVTDSSSLVDANSNTVIQYFDGLGRLIQTVQQGISTNDADLVAGVEYDAFGREWKKYLPGKADGNNGAYVTDYDSKSAASNNDSKPYATTEYEPSPLNRITGQYGAGNDWYSAGKKQTIEYLTNDANIAYYYVNSDKHLAKGTNYEAGSLYLTKVKDENWVSGNLHTTEEFKDKQGQVVLKRTFVKNEQDNIVPAETYYVYDDFGLLRYVIPPKALASISFPAGKDTAVIKSLCYYYEYDSRKRMVIKQLPGAEAVYMVYDIRDRLVATQDGNLRNHKNAGNQPDPLWLFTKYDPLNRPAITGIFTPVDTTREDLQTSINTYYEQEGKQFCTERGDVGLYPTGYKIAQSYPENITEPNLLTITYYDDYLFPGKQDFISVPELTVTSQNNKVVGTVTGGKVRILGNSTTWLTNTVYYDDKYRVIQAIKSNHLTSGFDRVTNQIDFSGRIQKSFTEHTGTTSVSTTRRFEYDHAGRLLQIWHKVNTSPEILMSYMVYNELGQLADKKIHSSDQGVNYLQSIDYRYNIRGWLTKINSPGTVGVSHPNEGNVIMKPDAFGMEIKYIDPFNH